MKPPCEGMPGRHSSSNSSRRPQLGSRIRLKADQSVGSLTPMELLDQFWLAGHMDPAEQQSLNELARGILDEDEQEMNE